MKTLGRLVLSAFLALLASLAVAALFLPFHSIFLPPDGVSCLHEGISGCIRTLEISLLVYGPLFCIIGVLIGTPVFMLLLYLRD
ncbi:hypothetical protein [Comamonas testosteroni]|uniref:Uncharacterized protein n=1 Tax=Comamonas testosteroni TaxID=285 RepID=A0A8B4S3Y4_COMTE|nr:hypothetical protein [Comamonas testosteroni]EHN63871.1 hypothetical protein CTATCC11996_20134 [Comamonas testosteroni ATCC 11996]QQN69039.1 hypothetical protein IYN88_20360 [Comamonas testosteroni]SUY77606.1 Uncharacterised protein [Comamonas testosteroni]